MVVSLAAMLIEASKEIAEVRRVEFRRVFIDEYL
jgi:hypothetical protein